MTQSDAPHTRKGRNRGRRGGCMTGPALLQWAKSLGTDGAMEAGERRAAVAAALERLSCRRKTWHLWR